MDKKINLSQLADLMAQAGGMSKTASEQFVKTFFDIISQTVLNDGLVKVKGLGTFKLLQMEDRESVNVNTGERFTIEGHQKISFTPDAELKDRINKPFAAFETVEITAEQAEELARYDEENVSGEDTPQVAAQEPQEESKEPVVRDVTQNRFVRFLLKLFVWILSIALILFLLAYLFWPLAGNSVLDFIEHKIKQRDNIEVVADSVKAEPVAVPVEPAQPVKPVQPVQPAKTDEPAKPEQAKPTQPAKPAQPATSLQPAKPMQPVQQQSKPATTAQPAKPEPKPEPVVVQSSTQYGKVQLNSRDQAKDLSEFTEADTVNFIMDGELAVHTLQSGETITKLALKYYGTKKLWPYIVKYNNIKDSGKIHEGSKIRIPVLKAK